MDLTRSKLLLGAENTNITTMRIPKSTAATNAENASPFYSREQNRSVKGNGLRKSCKGGYRTRGRRTSGIVLSTLIVLV